MSEIVLKLLTDVLQAGERIQRFLQGMTFEKYAGDE